MGGAQGKTLMQVFAEERIKEKENELEEQFKKDIESNPEAATKAIVDLLHDLPSEIRSEDGVKAATNSIKGIKDTIKIGKKKRKEAEAPFEEARKRADSELKAARQGKTDAGAPFKELINTAQDAEKTLRDRLSEYSDYLSHKEAEERRKQQEALDAARKKQEEALKAQEEFMESGDANTLAEVDQLMEESKQHLNEAQEAEAAALVAPKEEIKGVAMRKDVTFEVQNIDNVPDKYFTDVPDYDEINKKLKATFPGMRITISSIEILNHAECFEYYLLEDLNSFKILEDLKADDKLVIPGILRTFKNIPIVR